MVQDQEKVGTDRIGLYIDDRVQLTDEAMRAPEFQAQMERVREVRKQRKLQEAAARQ